MESNHNQIHQYPLAVDIRSIRIHAANMGWAPPFRTVNICCNFEGIHGTGVPSLSLNSYRIDMVLAVEWDTLPFDSTQPKKGGHICQSKEQEGFRCFISVNQRATQGTQITYISQSTLSCRTIPANIRSAFFLTDIGQSILCFKNEHDCCPLRDDVLLHELV